MEKLQQMMFALPSNLLRFAGSDVPRDVKMTAARGNLPVPPRDLATVLYALTRDESEDIKSQARNSLAKLPPPIIKTLLPDMELHPLILDFFM